MSDLALEKTISADEAGALGADSGRLEAGARLGRYQIVEFIGGGGMGWVYRARDTELERDVAIKVVQPSAAGARGRDRLLAEARAMAKLRHRAVVPVFDVGEFAGGVYVAMALVTGGTLHDWMHDAVRPWRQVVARFVEAGRGLVAAHAAGIVHRDFKPRNVLVSEAGEVMVADFGIASASAGDGDASRESSTIAGTPAYMAPEQAVGGLVDARADQYSFCISLWEGLHGQRPQEAETRTQGALLATASAAPKARRRIPGWLTTAVARGFAPTADKRWPTLGALLEVLERGLRRRRNAILAGSVVGLAAAAAATILITRPAAGDPCPAPAGVDWAASRARIERAFRATGAPFAESTLARVLPPLESYTSTWRTRMIESCRATRVAHTQSPELHARRSLCFDARRSYVAGLIETFATADRVVVAGADQSVAALPNLEECDRSDELLARPLAPPDQHDAVEAIRAQLATGRDLHRRGRYADALPLFEAATDAARSTRWSPILAEALAAHVALKDPMMLPHGPLLDELVAEAAKSRDDRLTLDSMTRLINSEIRNKNLERATTLEPMLVSAVLRVEGLPGTEHLLANAAVVRARRASLANDGDLADTLLRDTENQVTSPALKAFVIGTRATLQRDHRAAVPLFARAVEQYKLALGERHPLIAAYIAEMSMRQLYAGDLDGAEATWQTAETIFKEAFDTDAPSMSDFLQAGAVIAQYRRRFADARDLFTRAIKIYRETGMGNEEAQVERNLAVLLSDGMNDRAQAEPHYRRAVELAEDRKGRESIEYADAEASLGIFLAEEDCGAGMPLLEHARSLLEPAEHPVVVGVLGQLSTCAAATDRTLAARYLTAAKDVCAKQGCDPGQSAYIEFSIGQLLVEDSATRADGVAALRRALAAFQKLGDPETIAEIEKALARWKR